MRPIPTFSDPALSLWQAAIHAVILRHDPTSATGLSADHPVMAQAVAAGQALDRASPAPPGAAACRVADSYAGLATRFAMALFDGNRQDVDDLCREFQYSTLDPLWTECLAEYQAFLMSGRSVPYRSYDPQRIATDFVLPLPSHAGGDVVIAVVGDWGTGTSDARGLLAAVAAHQPDVLIHLGDIYYAGTTNECQSHFYDVVTAQFPGAAGPAIPTYTLAGNHDMYSGGAGYYHLLDQLGQPASFFCLRNADWQILALDTGLHDRDVRSAHSCLTALEPSEALWHQDKLRHAEGRKTIVLSHHQLCSAASGGVGVDAAGHTLAVNPNLYQTFDENGVSLQDVALWLWGHEHNLVVFEPYGNLARGRCIGSGAIPVATATNPYSPNLNLQPPPGDTALPCINPGVELGHDDEVYNRGYATITLSGATAAVRYYQWVVDSGASELLYTEVID